MTAAGRVGGEPVVASVGGDEPGADDLVDGELPDDGLAAERLRHRDAQHAAARDAPDLGRSGSDRATRHDVSQRHDAMTAGPRRIRVVPAVLPNLATIPDSQHDSDR